MSCHDEFFTVLVPSWSHVLLLAPELNCHTGLLNARKAFLVNEFSETSFESEHFFTGATKKELNGIKDVGFARTIESGDGIKLRIKTIDDGTVHVGFEAFEDDLFDVHCGKKSESNV